MQKEKIIRTLTCTVVALVLVSVVLAVLLVKEKKKTNIIPDWNAEAISAEEAANDGYYRDEYMQEAIDNAIQNETGGPIGAVITRKNGELVVSTSNHNTTINTLLHAEIHAIEQAQEILGTRDLSDCILYTSAEPCLMCASAIANVKMFKVYYAADFKDSEAYGFSDEDYYIKTQTGKTLTDWVHIEKENRTKSFELWYQRKHKK